MHRPSTPFLHSASDLQPLDDVALLGGITRVGQRIDRSSFPADVDGHVEAASGVGTLVACEFAPLTMGNSTTAGAA
jgi:hypothetical protein